MSKVKKFLTERPSFKTKKSAERSGLIRLGRGNFYVKQLANGKWKSYPKKKN